MKHFRLSCRGRVAAALTLSLICAQSAWAEGIVPAAGSGVSVQTAPNGASIVQIAPPSAAGLSHNRFNDYNVGSAGAVLNNAREAGTSQLAGALQANAGLGGRAASVILNEVVSRNPSLLLGKQEIFGKAADFVLANPNGISCNGCGFINTPRASLVVGVPQLEDGRLVRLSTAGAAGRLSIGADGVAGPDLLDLIAPSLDTRGKVVAASGIRAISGSSAVDYASGEATPEAGGRTAQIDSAYLGGMQAGRISIVSTDEGAGVNLSGLIDGGARLGIETRGKLEVEAATLKGGAVVVSAAEVAARSRVTTRAHDRSAHDESWFIWKTGASDVTDREIHSSTERTRIEGDRVKIVAGRDLALSAVDIQAGDLVMAASGSIKIDGVESLESTSRTQDAWKNSWRYNQYTEESRVTQSGSRIESTGNMLLGATGRVDVAGARLVSHGDLRLSAGEDLRLTTLSERETTIDRGSRYLDGPGLESGNWDKARTEERLLGTSLEAGRQVVLGAGRGQLSVEGSRVRAGGDIALLGGADIGISAQQTDQTRNDTGRSTQWGGIGGSDRKNDHEQRSVNVSSDILAQGALTVRAEGDIRIAGSQVQGGKGASAETRRGEVLIEHVTDRTQSHVDERRGGAFDIQTGRRLGDDEHGEVKAAQVRSETNLRLKSGSDLSVSGSRVEASGELDVRAAGQVRIDAAASTRQSSLQTTQLGGVGTAGKDARTAGNYRVEGGIELTEQQQRTQTRQHSGGELQGGSVRIEAEGQVVMQGGKVSAQAGDVSIRGSALDFQSVEDAQSSRNETAQHGMGVYGAGGIDELKVGLWQRSQQTRETTDTVTAAGSRVQASGQVELNAGTGVLTSHGADFEAGGRLSVQAGQIDNRAATGSSSRTRQESSVSTELGVGVELGGLLKPLEGVVDKVKSGDFSGALSEAGALKESVSDGIGHLRDGDWSGALQAVQQLGVPSAVVQVSQTGQLKSEDQNARSARGSRYSGTEVRVVSTGALKDQSTRYEASTGQVEVRADSQRFESAPTSSQTHTTQTDWNVGVKVGTTTGSDLSVDVALGGSHADQRTREDGVQAGAMRGAGGVKIDVRGDAVLQATRVEGGAGAVEMRAGGDLRLEAAQTSSLSQAAKTGGSLQVDVNMQPGGDALKMGGGGKLDWEVSRQHDARTDWQGTQVNAEGGVSLQAGRDVSLQASRVGAGADAARASSVSVQAGGAIELASRATGREQSSWGTRGDVAAEARADTQPGGAFNVKVDVKSGAQSGQAASSIDGKQVVLSSGGDTRVTGSNVTGDRIEARTGGDLRVTSVQETNRSDGFSLEVGASTPNVGTLTGKDEKLTLRGDLGRERLDAAVRQSGLNGSEKLDVQVGGQTVLEGGALQSAGAGVRPAGGGTVTATTLPGEFSSTQYGVDVAGTPLDIAKSAGASVLAGKLPFGLKREARREYRPMPAVIGQK